MQPLAGGAGEHAPLGKACVEPDADAAQVGIEQTLHVAAQRSRQRRAIVMAQQVVE